MFLLIGSCALLTAIVARKMLSVRLFRFMIVIRDLSCFFTVFFQANFALIYLGSQLGQNYAYNFFYFYRLVSFHSSLIMLRALL